MVENFGTAILDVTLTQSIPGAPAASSPSRSSATRRRSARRRYRSHAHSGPRRPLSLHPHHLDRRRSAVTRFGMREFRFDTATKRAYLNGKVFFFRGSNINLHRFFEDPNCGNLPWDDAWTANSRRDSRRCTGTASACASARCRALARHRRRSRPPDPVRVPHLDRPRSNSGTPPWDRRTLINEYQEFLRDNWNHPSIVLWDAANETDSPLIRDQVIPWVRTMDKSNRAGKTATPCPRARTIPSRTIRTCSPPSWARSASRWPNSSSGPEPRAPTPRTRPSRFVHQRIRLAVAESRRHAYQAHAKGLRHCGRAERHPRGAVRWNAYLLAGLTEYWRAHRNFAGVLHFVYLTASFPGAYTSDHFLDVRTLQLEPNFADYVAESFKPLGVYINSGSPSFKPASAIPL